MAEVTLDVPHAFWSDHEPEVIHLRRVAPGHLEVLEPGEAARILSGADALPDPAGWLELAELHLSVVEADGALALRPRLWLRRLPVDANGRVGHGADRDLPSGERRAKDGWHLSAAEGEILRAAIVRLAKEHEDLFCAPEPARVVGMLGLPR